MLSFDRSDSIKALGQTSVNYPIFHKFKGAFEVEISL